MSPQALYRFYDAADQLLYVGVTMDLPGRWKAHRDDKPWWTEVARCTVEHHPDRAAVLEAERAAIQSEKPRYNVVHNRTTQSGRVTSTPQTERLLPFQAGDWAAFGMRDGRCPVGEVTAYDDTWVGVRLKDFWNGSLTNRVVALRWSDVEQVELAYLEDAKTDDTFGAARVMDDDHLGEFQSAWQRVHLGPEGRDPVEQARIDRRREEAELARRMHEIHGPVVRTVGR